MRSLEDTKMIVVRRMLHSFGGRYESDRRSLIKVNVGHTKEEECESEDGNQRDRQAEVKSARRKRMAMNPLEILIIKDLQKGGTRRI